MDPIILWRVIPIPLFYRAKPCGHIHPYKVTYQRHFEIKVKKNIFSSTKKKNHLWKCCEPAVLIKFLHLRTTLSVHITWLLAYYQRQGKPLCSETLYLIGSLSRPSPALPLHACIKNTGY